MTTNPQSTEPTPEPCPLPEPLRSVAQECCSCCKTGTITNGYGVEAVRPPRRSFDGSKHSMNWTHDLVRGGCGYGCTASALYELNARVSATVAPTVDHETLADQVLEVLNNPGITEATYAKLKDVLAAASPVAPVGQSKHHKHCSSWTVTTSGEKKPCDCVCQCTHSMFEHIRPGEHYWYEDCAVEGCSCMKFTAPSRQVAAVVDR